MKKSFVKSAFIIMLATLTSKVIGAFYRIPLTNLLGAEGMGIYQLVYPVYAVMLTVSSGALPLAISVLVSENLAKGNLVGNKKLIKASFIILFTMGVSLATALILLSGSIASLQGSRTAWVGYVTIAPSILFVGGIAVLKGWFQGNYQMHPTALSSIIESVVKLIAGLTLARILSPYGVALQVGGALAGVSLSELATFVVLFTIYKKRKAVAKVPLSFSEARVLYKELLNISLPITLGSMIFPLIQFIDSFMVVNILKTQTDVTTATAMYGLFSGPVSTLVNLPVSLSLAIGIAVVPHLSKNKEERNLEAIRIKTSTAIKVAVLIGLPFTILFALAPKEILSFLYGSLTELEVERGAVLLTISSFSIVLLAVTQICTSVLQGLKDTRAPIINLGIGGLVKIVTSVILLYTIGINGVAVSGLVAFFVTALLNVISVFRLMGKNRDIVKNSGVMLLFSGIMSVSIGLAVIFGLKTAWILVVTMLSGVVYLLLVVLKAFNEEEILSLPFGSKIIKLKRRV